MKNNLSIQIKAALLLLVFGLNTVIGFACAVGMDMGFNTVHHKKESEAIKVHIHADGKKHQHPKKSANHHHQENSKDSKEKGGCCNDSVIKFSQTDKSLPQSVAVISPVFFTAFIASFYIPEIFYPSQAKVSVKYFVRGHHPPIPDIRVAIQSFQI